MKRVQVLYRFRNLIDRHLDELTFMVCTENGRVWQEAQGDVLKAKEIVEFACGIRSLIVGESPMDASTGFDTTLYREPLGVFAGHKSSFFGDLHALGKDGVRFYTESKCVTSTWFDEEERRKKKTSTWEAPSPNIWRSNNNADG